MAALRISRWINHSTNIMPATMAAPVNAKCVACPSIMQPREHVRFSGARHVAAPVGESCKAYSRRAERPGTTRPLGATGCSTASGWRLPYWRESSHKTAERGPSAPKADLQAGANGHHQYEHEDRSEKNFSKSFTVSPSLHLAASHRLDERGGVFVACWIAADRALFQGFPDCDTANHSFRTASEFGSPVTMIACRNSCAFHDSPDTTSRTGHPTRHATTSARRD